MDNYKLEVSLYNLLLFQTDAISWHNRISLARLRPGPGWTRDDQPVQEIHRQVLQQSEAESQRAHCGSGQDVFISENFRHWHLHRVKASWEWYSGSQLYCGQSAAPHSASFYTVFKLGTILFVYSTSKIKESVSIGVLKQSKNWDKSLTMVVVGYWHQWTHQWPGQKMCGNQCQSLCPNYKTQNWF